MEKTVSGVRIMLGRPWNRIGTGCAPIPKVLDKTITPTILVESEELVPIFVPCHSYHVFGIPIGAPLLTHDECALEWKRSYHKSGDLYLHVPCAVLRFQYWIKNVGDDFDSNGTSENN